MKTVFQRALSVIMCVILVVCTMSTMAYAATDFTYDKFMDKTAKSVEINTIPLLDEVDKVLAEQNITIDLSNYGLGVIDATSIDKALASVDNLRGLISTIKILSNDLNTLTFDAFEKGLTRKEDGDVKIITELLELIATNGEIVSDVLAGTFSLGLIDGVLEEQFKFKFSEIPNLIKGALVDIFYDEGDAEYAGAEDRVLNNFDAFMCQDIIPYVIGLLTDAIGLDPANSNLALDTKSTVNTVIADIFDIIVVNLKTVIGKLNVNLEGTALDSLKNELILKGTEYNLDGIGFDGSSSVLGQINTVVGQIVKQLVPNYTGWQTGDYTKIENNVRNIFLYLADKGGFTTTNKSDVAIMVDVLKAVFAEVNVPGDYSKCTTLEAMAKELIKSLAIKEELLPANITYTSSQTYEHVLGDIIIALLSDDVLIAAPDGKVCAVGDGYDIWTVWNYILNFFFVDKNLDLLLGKDGMTKTSTLFQKLDSICDMFADDGTSAFATETYIKSLINSIFTLDLSEFVELTAVKALSFAKEGTTPGGVTVSKFVYKALYAFLYNWAGKKAVIPAFTSVTASKPFNDALSGANLGKLAETVLTALSGYTYQIDTFLGIESKEIIKAGTSRVSAVCSALGLIVDGPETVSVEVSSVADVVYTGKTLDPAAVVYATHGGKKVRLEQNVDYKVTVAKNAVGSTTATIEGIGAYEGAVTGKSVKVKFGTISGLSAKPASTSSVTLSWNKLAGATSYNVYNGSTVKKVTTNSYTVTGLKAGTKYTFKVEAVNGSNKSAQASVSSVTLPAQVGGLKATTPSNTSVKLTWNKVTGAAGYYVQQYSSGKWSTVKTVTTNSVTLSAKANTAYQFRVIAYSANSAGTKYSGAASASVSVRTAPNKPSSFAKKTVTATTVALSWKKVSGATGYAVEQYKSGKWTQIGTTKSTSYTVKKLSANTKYKFRIRAYVTASKKNYYSAYTSSVSATTLLAAPKSFKVKEATATSIKLSWKKVSGAKKYQVYYSTNNGKKWKKATTSKTSYTISDLKANTAVQIKVRVYNSSKVVGDYTSVLSTSTAPSKVSLKKLSAGKKKFTVTWKKVSGAEGYEVQYATKSNFKKGVKTVTVKKGKTVKSEVKKLKKGTKYYVRVRAYKTVNGKKLYGKYSEYESVKVK